jgi:hypothetical protein
MRARKNNLSALFLFALFTILTLPSLSPAADLYELGRNAVGFANNARPGSTLLLSQDGQADWLVGARLERKEAYRILDQACVPVSQNTAIKGGLTLAFPFLVGAGKACFIDEGAKSIRLLSDFRASLPRGPYSAAYAGADDKAAYFLVNGARIDGSSGYLQLVSIAKDTLAVAVGPLVTDVPGASGSMVFAQEAEWIASWPGSLYKVELAKLQSLIKSGKTAAFSQVATEEFSGIEGMSLFVLANERSFLYFNGDFAESYVVARANGARTSVQLACAPLAGYDKQWLTLCNGHLVESWGE